MNSVTYAGEDGRATTIDAELSLPDPKANVIAVASAFME